MANYMTFMRIDPDFHPDVLLAIDLDAGYEFEPFMLKDATEAIRVTHGEDTHIVQGDFNTFNLEVLGGRKFGF